MFAQMDGSGCGAIRFRDNTVARTTAKINNKVRATPSPQHHLRLFLASAPFLLKHPVPLKHPLPRHRPPTFLATASSFSPLFRLASFLCILGDCSISFKVTWNMLETGMDP